MENEVEEMLRCILLPSHLEVAELQSLKVTPRELRQEVETELDRLHLFHHELDNLERIALLMDLLDHQGLLDQDRMDELYQFMLKRVPFLPKFALKNSRIVDV